MFATRYNKTIYFVKLDAVVDYPWDHFNEQYTLYACMFMGHIRDKQRTKVSGRKVHARIMLPVREY